MPRILPKFLLIGAAVASLILVLAQLSPWPSALAIRVAMDSGGWLVNRELARRVPAGLIEQLNRQYAPGTGRERLDVFTPAAVAGGGQRPIGVWIHGGGFVAGSKEQVGNYARILAGLGFTVVAVDYSLAPERTYPAPLQEVNQALAYLQRESGQLGLTSRRFVLAGDSAGALLAAQLATITTAPAYARRLGIVPALAPEELAGVLLYCGPYDVHPLRRGDSPGWFLHTILWAYFGRRDFAADPLLPTLRVLDYVTGGFPPSYLSVGNADPLAPQSLSLAAKLRVLGVRVETQFFDAGHAPALGHEYQFNLDTAEGRETLHRSAQFLGALH